MAIDFTGSTDAKPLTRSQHPDLRLFTQVPGKLAWYSNRSYKTQAGCTALMNSILQDINGKRRNIEYSVRLFADSKYRVLAKPVKREVVK